MRDDEDVNTVDAIYRAYWNWVSEMEAPLGDGSLKSHSFNGYEYMGESETTKEWLDSNARFVRFIVLILLNRRQTTNSFILRAQIR